VCRNWACSTPSNVWERIKRAYSSAMRSLVKCQPLAVEKKNSKNDTHKVPQRAECRDSRFLAALHDLRITSVVRGDENDCGGYVLATSMAYVKVYDKTFGPPVVIRLFQDLHRIWPATPELRIPQQETLGSHVAVDKAADCWTERLFLIRA
jgi:hypothetical protein